MNMLNEMGLSKLSANIFFKVNYFFNCTVMFVIQWWILRQLVTF